MWKLDSETNDDTMIMEALINLIFKLANLQADYRCRLYSWVFSLSDNVTGDGDGCYLNLLSLKGHIHAVDRYSWPIQSCPPPQDWKIWRNRLCQTFTPQFDLLDVPLKEWLISDDTAYYSTWEWWTDDSNCLFQ